MSTENEKLSTLCLMKFKLYQSGNFYLVFKGKIGVKTMNAPLQLVENAEEGNGLLRKKYRVL